MADRIYIRAWKKDTGTSLADREIAILREDKTLCIGTPNGFIEFVPKEYVDNKIAELNAKIEELQTQ